MATRLRAALGLLGFVAATTVIFATLFGVIDLRRANQRQIAVGSKAFTESILLGEIMAQLIEKKTGLPVERRMNLGGTHICFVALVAGEIDLYAEYTGTGLAAILAAPTNTDPTEVLTHVRREFRARWELEWLAPMQFNNTYALAMAEPRAEELGIRKVSDLTKHLDLLAGFPAEFMAREDGYPGLRVHYGLDFEREPKTMEAGLMYGAVANGEVDVISAYATDGRIEKFQLRVLEDDRAFFPPYQATPLARSETLGRHPGVAEALAVLGGKITDAEMRKMNAEIDLGGRSVEDVAAQFVVKIASNR